jgi:hypothetical protein
MNAVANNQPPHNMVFFMVSFVFSKNSQGLENAFGPLSKPWKIHRSI